MEHGGHFQHVDGVDDVVFGCKAQRLECGAEEEVGGDQEAVDGVAEACRGCSGEVIGFEIFVRFWHIFLAASMRHGFDLLCSILETDART